ncbi:MAG TPA: dienelactone hydrolase family protein [Solirubrobacterales bacterium]|nr:dienelactone hydrolase family protein [Solirubrobacterales bacterium]
MSDFDLGSIPREPFTHDGVTHDIFRLGEGPAVIVIAEMPGITPKVMAFAERVAGLGCTAVLPVLFGEPGRDPDPKAHGTASALGYTCRSMVGGCASREFTVWATGKSSPIVTWLRALARSEHERCGGPGVGAVGMCFTGGYALAMATDEVILAPVLSQPSMPLALTPRRANTIDIGPDELERVKHRCAHEDLKVIGMRFKGDRLVPSGRFKFLREQLGDAFVAVELEDEDANPDSIMPPHSVLTEHLIDEPGEPTRQALDDVLELFRERLLGPPA